MKSTPSKESDTLVDPASVSVIGVVSDQVSAKSPVIAAAPEKKSKKEKPSTSKSTKSAGTKTDTDSKIRNGRKDLIVWRCCYWPDLLNQHFHLMSKSLPLTLFQLVSHKKVNLSSDLPNRSLLQLSFLALAPLLYSISQPVKLRPVCRQVYRPHLLCFLVLASLLPSINRPVKPRQVYHLQPQCFLVQASLLHSSRPVKFNHTNRPHQSVQAKMSLLPNSSLPVNSPTPTPLRLTKSIWHRLSWF